MQVLVLGVDQDKEDDEGDDGADHHKDAGEQAIVGIGTINGILEREVIVKSLMG